MPAVIPTHLADVPDYGQVIGPDSAPLTITPEVRRTLAGGQSQITVARIVPSYNDAIVSIIQAGFTIEGIEDACPVLPAPPVPLKSS